ncbi:MAG TPA: serine protease [Solirubrobacterales bacterium]|nr:serine protease [Solirubrobacterales bacterium]
MNKAKLLLPLLALALLVSPAPASAWAPAGQATIHPGVQTFTEGAQCTANFVFQEGEDVYLGQAAHCAGTGGATETDGCESGSLPLGTQVEVTGASHPGTLAYSSWLTMQARGETDPDACAFNDFALVRIDPADVAKVNPSVPGFGGPTGLGPAGEIGSTVYSYGNSSLRAGIRQLRPKQGVLVGNSGSGWSHEVLTVTPGVPGDSGSGFLNASGAAFGTLSTLQIAPLAGSNGVGDLARELSYLRSHTSHTAMQLVPGTEPWRPNLVGAILGS